MLGDVKREERGKREESRLSYKIFGVLVENSLLEVLILKQRSWTSSVGGALDCRASVSRVHKTLRNKCSAFALQTAGPLRGTAG